VLLPHAGVVIFENAFPSGDGSSAGEWVDGYSTTTGHRLWSVPAGRYDTIDNTGSPVPDFLVSMDTVFMWQDPAQGEPRIAAYNALTGRRLWITSFRTARSGSDGNTLLGAFDGSVYAEVYITASMTQTQIQIVAVNAANGAALWQHRESVPGDGPGIVRVTQVGSSNLVLTVLTSGSSNLLSASTGATLETTVRDTDEQVAQTCDPQGQLAIAFAAANAIHVLSGGTDRAFAIPSGEFGDVVITATEAYVLPQQAGAPVYGYDLATGNLLWTVQLPNSSNPGQSVVLMSAFNGGFIVADGPMKGSDTYYAYR
jgi:outer membrane protein assembly factor BamB